MKLSISLAEEDVATLDRYAKAAGIQSRSAAIQHAIRLLADPDLEDAYEAAWQEWEISGEAALWEGAASDGIDDVAR